MSAALTSKGPNRLLQLIDSHGGVRPAARHWGFSTDRVGRWRRGQGMPNWYAAAIIAHKDKVSLDWLIAGRGNQRDSRWEAPRSCQSTHRAQR